MSTDRRPLFVVRWNLMYLTGVTKHTKEPKFSYAPVHAERFETPEAAHARVSEAQKFPGGYEVVHDPTGSKA